MREKGSTSRCIEPLGQFIPRVTPAYTEPKHLAPLLSKLEQLHDGLIRVCVSVPPRHGKSDTVLHFVAWYLSQYPRATILYVTHTATFALKQSKTARRLAREAGVQLSEESNRADEWETTSGGGLTARGVDGEITGRGFDVILVDDPIKSHKVANSALLREGMFSWFTEDVFTRLTPTGSILVVHTRWHVDDLIGRLVSAIKFERINLRAIADNDNDPANGSRQAGDALWPEGGWTLDALADRRRHVGEFGWVSLFQGEPRPKGGEVFRQPGYYTTLPAHSYRVAYGVDLAYTAKTHADYSVMLELWRTDDDPKRPKFYVVAVHRAQVDAPSFTLTLKARNERVAPMLWYASGTEKGAADFIKRQGIPLQVMPATTDKFKRAQGVAAAWNDGRVLVPDTDAIHAPWLPVFLDEVLNFTGIADLHDDQVDALAAAFDRLSVSTGARLIKVGNADRI